MKRMIFLLYLRRAQTRCRNDVKLFNTAISRPQVVVVPLKINVNLKAQTVEELVRRRQGTLLGLLAGLRREALLDLRILGAAGGGGGAAEAAVLARCAGAAARAAARAPEWFNADERFKRALDEALGERPDILKDAVEAWAPDPEASRPPPLPPVPAWLRPRCPSVRPRPIFQSDRRWP
jgi:hypothetical protein